MIETQPKSIDIEQSRVLTQFSKMVVLGVYTLFFAQITINIGMNIGLLPITGITLPLISYGGSSLLTMLMGLGLVLSIDRGNESMI